MLHLNVYYHNFQPMLVLDFSDAFKSGRKLADEEEIERYNQNRYTKISTRIENKNKARQTIITTRLQQQKNQQSNNQAMPPIQEEKNKNVGAKINVNNFNKNNYQNNNYVSNPFAAKVQMFSGKK